MLIINQIYIEANEKNNYQSTKINNILNSKAADILSVKTEDIQSLTIHKFSIDARKKPDIFYAYTVIVGVKNEDSVYKNLKSGSRKKVKKYFNKEYKLPDKTKKFEKSPVVVGFGPAGMAAAFTLAKLGAKPIVIERGMDVDKRSALVNEFWESGKLCEKSNVQFGEGGAGAFSDGKLNTGNKDKDGLKALVLKTLVKYGAPERIEYDSKPHIGTDILTKVVKNIRNEVIKCGGQVLFNTKLCDIGFKDDKVTKITVETDGKTREIETDHLFLAIGHSARDTFLMLKNKGIVMEPKPFAVGYRVAHPQNLINLSQYGPGYEEKHLPAADYKLTYTAKSGRPVYSFCMCPGGYIVNAGSQNGSLCVNGMSYSKRDGKYANSAIVMGITPDEIEGNDCLKGLYFQEEMEKKNYELGEGRIPVCRLNSNEKIEDAKDVFKGKIKYIPEMLVENKALSDKLNRDFIEAMNRFGDVINKFNDDLSIISGSETRTSSPVRICRGEDYAAFGKSGLFPIGEGAGYAGGIMSAAMDGVRAVKSIIWQDNTL